MGAAVQCTIAVALSAQTVSRDPATGDHLITYVVDGTQYVARVAGPDRIAPEIELTSVTDSSGRSWYSYSLTNADRAPATAGRGIILLSLPCVGSGSAAATPGPTPAGWQWRSRMGIDDVPRCQFLAGRNAVLDPGEAVHGLIVTSTSLPAIGQAFVYGMTGTNDLPTGEETPDSVHELVASITRSGVAVSVVLPLLPIEAVSTFPAATERLKADLAKACGPLGWIDDSEICQDLQATLSASTAAFARSQAGAATDQLSAFRAELSALRGKHLNESAFVLLNRLAEHALTLRR